MEEELILDLKLFFSVDKDEIFMTIKASEANLEVQADLMDYHVQLVGESSTEPYKRVAPYGEFQMTDAYGNLAERSKTYKKYNSNDEEVADTDSYKGKLSYFTYKDKVRILMAMINSAVDMGELQENGILISSFCVHDRNLDNLIENWGNFKKFWKPQDFAKIRLYYGEKVAMYFAWLDYYVKWLIFPAFFGLIAYIVEYVCEDINDNSKSITSSEVSVFVFSIVLALGSTVFTQVWERRQNELSWEWGTSDINDVEQQRPSFKGVYGKDPITGQKKKLENHKRINMVKRSVGLTISTFFIFVSIALLVAIFIYRSIAAKTFGANGLRMCALLNALQIKFMNFVYRIVAKKLNDWENYEFDSDYNDSLAIKLYGFQFCNSYASLFYIAFFKKFNEGCDEYGCLEELKIQLSIIFLTNVGMNVFELGLPYLKSKFKAYQERKRIRVLKSQGKEMKMTIHPIEEQSKLADYETPLDDYMELIIDFGYVVMFSSAFSIVPLLALILNILEIRVDAFKLCVLTKRPHPTPANSIGEWQTIVKTISVIGTLTNAGIMIFTTDVFDLNTLSEK